MRGFLRTALLVVFTFLSACHRVPSLGNYPFLGIATSPTESQRLTHELSLKLRTVSPLRILTQCVMQYDAEHYSMRYAFVVSPDGRLRIEQFPSSGFYALTTLVSTSEGVTVLIPSEKRATMYSPGEEGMRELFGFRMPLQEADIGPLLHGMLPSRLRQEPVEYRLQGSALSNDFALRSKNSLAYYKTGQVLRELHLFDNRGQSELMRVVFEYNDLNDLIAFVIELPEEEAELSCRIVQRGKRDALRDTLFQIDIPHDYQIIDNRSGG